MLHQRLLASGFLFLGGVSCGLVFTARLSTAFTALPSDPIPVWDGAAPRPAPRCCRSWAGSRGAAAEKGTLNIYHAEKRQVAANKGTLWEKRLLSPGLAGDLLFIVTICLSYSMRAARHSLESAWHHFLFYLADAGWKIVFSSHCVHMEVNKNTGFHKRQWGCKVLVPGHETARNCPSSSREPRKEVMA